MSGYIERAETQERCAVELLTRVVEDPAAWDALRLTREAQRHLERAANERYCASIVARVRERGVSRGRDA